MRDTLLLFVAIFSSIFLFSCEEEPDTEACVHVATVDRVSAPDCGIILSLDEGGQVIPSWTYGWCGTGVDFDRIDSLQNMLQHGDRVRFGYSANEYAEPCQGIPYAYITCVEVLTRADTDAPIR